MNSRRSGLVVVTLVVSAHAALGAVPRALVPQDIANIHEADEVQLSPDGTRVVYALTTTDLAADHTYTNLWIAKLDGSDSHALTSGDSSQSHPRWSADGHSLAFLSTRFDANEDDQLWILPVDRGEATKITDVRGGIDDFAWSPDGTRVALVVTDPNPADAHPSAPIVIDRFQFQRDRRGFLTARYAHLEVLTLATHAIEVIAADPHDDVFPAWSPDGKSLAFATQTAVDGDLTDDWAIAVIEAHAGGKRRIVATAPQINGYLDEDQPLAWSPDGKWLAFLHGGDPKLIEYAAKVLAVVPAAGGATRVLAAALDRNMAQPRWTADSSAVLAIVESDGTNLVSRFPLTGEAPTPLVSGMLSVSSFDSARDGRLVVVASSPQRPAEVATVAAGAGGALRTLSHHNDAFLASVRLAAVDASRFTSADGTEIHGWTVHPLDARPGTPAPTLLRLHGGPAGQYSASFNFDAQLFAANGYLVLLPNPRGSTGRGTAFSKAIYADWGHLDVQDDLAAVDDAVAHKLADPDRLGVGGWSYGGMSANYLVATTTRFKASTSGAAISNQLAGYGTDHYIRDYEAELGKPWANTAAWMRVSYPFLHADRIKTPTLFLGGARDLDVPLLDSEQMYEAVRSLGVPTELIVYPTEFHHFRMPSNVIDRNVRYLAWYAKYLHAK